MIDRLVQEKLPAERPMLPYPPMAHAGRFVGCINSNQERAFFAKARFDCGLNDDEIGAICRRELRVFTPATIRAASFRYAMDVVLPKYRKSDHANPRPRSTHDPIKATVQRFDQLKPGSQPKENL